MNIIMNIIHMYSWLYILYVTLQYLPLTLKTYHNLYNIKLISKFQVYRFGNQSDWGLIKLFEWRQMKLFFVAIFGHFAIQNFDFNQ